MKMRIGQRVAGTYAGKSFSGTVTQVRQVDNYGRAAVLGEATIAVDDPKSLVGVFGCADPEGRDLLFPILTPTIELEDDRFEIGEVE